MIQAVKDIATRVWQIEEMKLSKNGLINTAIGYIILISYFYYTPIFAKSIWPQNVEDKFTFQLCTIPTIVGITTVLYSLIYLPGYLGVKAYKKYETEPNLKKPWEKENWDSMKWRTLKYVLINHIIVFPLYIYIGLITVGVSFTFDNFPTHWEIIKCIGFAIVADDFLYMWIHRILHLPSLYRFHKMHHEYDSVMSAINQFCHPVEHLVANILPSTIVFSFFRVHIFTFFVWQFFKLYSSVEGHSGYEFPWSPTRVLPFIYGSSYHYFHHSKNVGNFATSFYLFELICGTNKVFFDRELANYQKTIKAQ